jgi:hypothetical protein
MSMIIDKEHCKAASALAGENRDCSVVACAVAAQIDYNGMREYLATYGRETGGGLYAHQYHDALKALGLTLTKLKGPRYDYTQTLVAGCDVLNRRTREWHWKEEHYRTTRKVARAGEDYNGATVVTLARELTVGTYLVSVNRHVLCLRDGVVQDWAAGRRHRIESVHRVTV